MSSNSSAIPVRHNPPAALPPLHPWDEANQTLYQNVHPPDWVNPQPAPCYNLVVIGGGTAGLVTAVGAAGLGARVALVERHLLGGDCLNVGCVPSKALLRAARAAEEVRRAGEFGVRLEGSSSVDFAAVMTRMRRVRAELSPHDSAARFRGLGVDVFIGEGRFSGTGTIEVANKTLRFSKAVIATGARAGAPPVPGLADVAYLTNETIFSLTELPRRLGIIGAGPIGCEMAQAFARFGSEVYLVETQHGILPREDRDAADLVQTSMTRDGVKLLCCGHELKVHSSGKEIRLQVKSHSERYDTTVHALFIAAGRVPNIERLELEKAEIQWNGRGVEVNDRLQTTNPKVYACGDVCSRFQFTHAADAMARIVIQNALFHGRKRVGNLVIPWCTYTSPEVAHVGVSEVEAKAKHLELDTITQPLDGVDRAILDGEAEGFVRVHLRKGTDRILGATVVASHAGEVIGMLTLAMTGKIGLKAVGNVIQPYPTVAEAIRKTGDLYNRGRLTPAVKNLFRHWLGWQRR